MMGYWGNMMGGWGYGYGNSNYWWIGLIMMAFQFVFWVAVAVLVIRLLRGRDAGVRTTTGDSALELLKQRYAKGEIDTEEFTARKKELLQ